MFLVSDLLVELASGDDFAARQWFYATPDWYYHRPRHQTLLRPTHDFYQLVDPDLRPICQFLHRKGLVTTPSCQGHFHSAAHLRHVYAELRAQEHAIRNGGQLVRDSENQSPALFRNPHYQLPWPTFEAFRDQVAPSQQHGTLGILVSTLPLSPTTIEENHWRIDSGDHQLTLAVHAPNPESQSLAWRQIHTLLRRLPLN
jgi:hypothetical protein